MSTVPRLTLNVFLTGVEDPEQVEEYCVTVMFIDMVATEREMARQHLGQGKVEATGMYAWHALRRTVGGMGTYDEFLPRVITITSDDADDGADGEEGGADPTREAPTASL